MKHFSVRRGAADDPSHGHTVNIEYLDGDVLTIEITEERDQIWVQYSTYDKASDSLVPGDGHKVIINPNKELIT